jgi:hypothetical protein
MQAVISRLSAGEQDSCRDEMPALGAEADAAIATAASLSTNGAAKKTELISVGSLVRVVKQERSRRATISFIDEDEGTVDVMYSASASGPEDEDGVPVKSIQALLPFELAPNSDRFQESLFKGASALKEEGNQLFKLKDFDAASERYSAVVAAFAARSRERGQQVLVCDEADSTAMLKAVSIRSLDADGGVELSDGREVAKSATLPVFQELLPLQAAAHMNRARCLQSLASHARAAQDLTVVLALWDAADKRMLEADMEMKEAATKGLYTAQYLRAKSRLARGLCKQAARDVKLALARKPPAATQKQLRELSTQVQAALEEHRRVNGPLAKELAKVSIAIRGLLTIS